MPTLKSKQVNNVQAAAAAAAPTATMSVTRVIMMHTTGCMKSSLLNVVLNCTPDFPKFRKRFILHTFGSDVDGTCTAPESQTLAVAGCVQLQLAEQVNPPLPATFTANHEHTDT
jgi:hypothetical protein